MADSGLPQCCRRTNHAPVVQAYSAQPHSAQPLSPTSPAYRRFLPPLGSTPGAPRDDEYEVYYEEEEWIPYSDSSLMSFDNREMSRIPGAPGSNYIVIEEEVVEEIPVTPTHGSPTVVKRTRRKITRRVPQGPTFAQRLAAMAEDED